MEKIEKIGEVTAVDGSMLVVTFCRPTDCEKCGACEGGKKQTTLRLEGNANVGDSVVVSMPSKTVLHASAIAYLVPLAGLAVGIVVGTFLPVKDRELCQVICSLAGLGLSAAVIMLTEKFRKNNSEWQPKLIEVIHNSKNN